MTHSRLMSPLQLGMLVTTPATFFSEARKIIRHHRDLEAKMVELREEVRRISSFSPFCRLVPHLNVGTLVGPTG